jgi:hypothetical protein
MVRVKFRVMVGVRVAKQRLILPEEKDEDKTKTKARTKTRRRPKTRRYAT